MGAGTNECTVRFFGVFFGGFIDVACRGCVGFCVPGHRPFALEVGQHTEGTEAPGLFV